ncbi:MAG: hypothetical protein CME06_16475 [Gemmatimonadetes bacterium]|nr:hypothetical protein [Gemmatimonadota bacterium]
MAAPLIPILALSLAASSAEADWVVRAFPVDGGTIQIDGRLDETIWSLAAPIERFTQKDPDPGQPSTLKTAVSLAYDDEALYVGARMHADPDEILATVSRRDQVGSSERIIVSLDTYRDRRTAYSFALTATDVRADYYHSSDSEHRRDYSFDPVWEGKSAIDEQGWSAEMRIPFSQLRFNDTGEWGLNLNRWVPTRNEDSYWIYISRDETGWASRMGALVGIEGIEPSRRIELLPYAAATADLPSGDGRWLDRAEGEPRIGADLKMGIGPNLTLDATVNPDFGQVEADPAEVNLSAFETFFDEKRPFFTEGAQLLSGPGPGYFYSRRIGAAPRGVATGGTVLEQPEHTTILGAGKLTGRLESGLSVGALAALTSAEHATIEGSKTTEIEPLSEYGVLRLRQEIGNEGSTIGALLTGVERSFGAGGDLATQMARRAYSGGTDCNLRLRGGEYFAFWNLGFSHLRGDPRALVEVQRSSAHYFHRPDAAHVAVDSSRTTMTGYMTSAGIARHGGEHWLWSFGASVETPDFELNDVGRLRSADDTRIWHTLTWRENDRIGPFQRMNVGFEGELLGNSDGLHRTARGQLESDLVWGNFWTSTFAFGARRAGLNDKKTRGGPLMGTALGASGEASLASNWAGPLTWHTRAYRWWDETGGGGGTFSGGLTWRLAERWEARLEPRIDYNLDTRQYVTAHAGGPSETFEQRYIFASLDQTTLLLQARLNLAITPDLTFELYAEPFASSGRYSAFGELARPRDDELLFYGERGTTIEGQGGLWRVTDGDEEFSFVRSDFRFHSFRSNAVLRWEWRPGSTLFLVWQSDRSEPELTGREVDPGSLFDALGAPGEHMFALKVNWWVPVG